MGERDSLRTVARAVKHRYYLVVAIVAAFTVVAAVAAIVRPPAYQGTALLFVDERFTSSQVFDVSLQTGQPLTDHFIQAATNRPVLERACSGTYFDTPATSGFSCDATTLMGRVSANTVSGPDWIAVNATAGSAAEAAALANAVARAMADQNKADVDQLLTPAHDYLNAELNRLGTDIQTEQATIDQLRNASAPGQQAAIAGHQANLNLLQSQYLATYAKIQDLVVEEGRLAQSLKLEQPAAPPLKPYDPDPVRYLAVGVVAGLCVALVTVLLVDRFDERVLDTEALSVAAGTRLVVAVASRDSATLTSRASNPYAMARANLLALHPDLNKVIVVAGSSRDRVRPVGAGLGLAAVKAGQKVLVVDAEAHRYEMQEQSGRNGSRMTIVGAPADGGGLAANGPLAGADDKYDLTITLTPPPDSHLAAMSLAHSGDLAIVVATAGVTRFSDVKRTSETLRLAGIKVAAGILAIDPAREVRAGRHRPPSTPGADVEPAVFERTVNQLRLPTWRGPGA